VDEHDFGARERARKSDEPFGVEDKTQYLLGAEEQLLQSISSHAPLPQVLNAICSALDCQIGSVVSLISLPGDDASDLAAIALNAAQFGLHIFYSERIVAETGELLGTLEMYSSVPRGPSAGECSLIERAKCLAALAIKVDRGAGHQNKRRAARDQALPGDVLEKPLSVN
jgi:hypothetical protein